MADISQLLGEGLPGGSTLTIKVGNQNLNPNSTSSPGSSANALGDGGTSNTPFYDKWKERKEKQSERRNCPEDRPYWNGFRCVAWEDLPRNRFKTRQAERRGCDPETQYWNGFRCVDLPTTTNPNTPNTPTTPGPPNLNDTARQKCESQGGTWNPATNSCDMSKVDIERRKQECTSQEGKVWSDVLGLCIDAQLPPESPNDVQTAPSPFENSEYYKWLFDSGYDEQMKVWQGQEDMINQTWDEGWQEIQARANANWGANSTETAELAAIYDRERTMTLNKAYSDMMNNYLDRFLERQKMALDFYLNNKAEDLTYAYQRGQLTINMLDEALGYDIKNRELKISIFRALTENAVGMAGIDQNWATIYTTFLDMANKFGISEADANAMWADITGKYGLPKSNMT